MERQIQYLRLVCLILCLTLPPLTSRVVDAAVYRISAGQLIGAQNVLVNGSYFDVDFVEGTAAGIWGVTEDGSSGRFDFITEADAQAAVTALGEQVFNNQIRVDYGSFSRYERDLYDTSPSRTYGVENNNLGAIVVPFNQQSDLPIFFYAMTFYNDASHATLNLADADYTGYFSTTITNDSAGLPNMVFARWQTASAPPVPVPGSAFLLGCGLFCLAGIRHRASILF